MVDDPNLEDEPSHEPHDWRQDEGGGLSECLYNESDAAAADDFYNRENESDR